MSRQRSDYLDNPKTQIRFHKRMMRVWQLMAVPMFAAYASTFFLPLKWAVLILGFINFVTCMLSLYANWDTDFGALSAAQASDKADLIDDVQDDTESIQAVVGADSELQF